MTLEEAYKIVKESDFSEGLTMCNLIEYKSYFVFDYRLDPNENELDSLVGVEKKTGRVSVFSPTMISYEEFIDGKELSISLLED